MKRILTTLAAMTVTAMSALAQAGVVHYDLVGTSPTTWNLYATVSGADTAGLAGFSVTATSSTPSTFSFNNLKNTSFDGNSYLAGFTTQTVNVFPDNTVVGASQASATVLVLNVGKASVNQANSFGAPFGSPVMLDVPAFLGTLTTAANLDVSDFAFNGTLFTAGPSSGNSVLSAGNTTVTSTVTPAPVPEPATLALLALGGLAFLRRSHA